MITSMLGYSGSMLFSSPFGAGTGFFIGLLVLWTFIWKGLALWRASKEHSVVWFVILLVINTAGILEILYLYLFSKRAKKEHEHSGEQHDRANQIAVEDKSAAENKQL